MKILRNKQYSIPGTVREILETEAPLSEEFFLKRIISYFGREKVTKPVLEEFNRKMLGCRDRGIIRRRGFMYLRDMGNPKLRIPGDRRDVKYIAPEELADGLRTLIEQNVTVTRDGLYKSMTNLLGFSRTGETMSSRFEEALNILKKNGTVKEEDGLLSIN